MKESEAITACTDALDEMSPPEQERIIRYLTTKYLDETGPVESKEVNANRRVNEEFHEMLKQFVSIVEGSTAGDLTLKSYKLWSIVVAMKPHVPELVRVALEKDMPYLKFTEFCESEKYLGLRETVIPHLASVEHKSADE